MTTALQLRLYTSPTGLYLTVQGRLDATNAHQLGKAIAVALDRFDTPRLTLDLSNLQAIDAAGISTLMLFRDAARGRDVLLTVADTPAHIRAAISAAGTEDLLARPASPAANGAFSDHLNRTARRSFAAGHRCLRGPARSRRGL